MIQSDDEDDEEEVFSGYPCSWIFIPRVNEGSFYYWWMKKTNIYIRSRKSLQVGSCFARDAFEAIGIFHTGEPNQAKHGGI